MKLNQTAQPKVLCFLADFWRSIAEVVACNMRFASGQMGKNPCESVKSVSSAVYEFERIPVLVPHRPRMTLIRRICTDTASSLAICHWHRL
jgi:hypothetical protein